MGHKRADCSESIRVEPKEPYWASRKAREVAAETAAYSAVPSVAWKGNNSADWTAQQSVARKVDSMVQQSAVL